MLYNFVDISANTLSIIEIFIQINTYWDTLEINQTTLPYLQAINTELLSHLSKLIKPDGESRNRH